MNGIEQTIYDIAKALEVPVLVLAVVALAAVLVELGSFVVELVRRRGRDYSVLATATANADRQLTAGNAQAAKIELLSTIARNEPMAIAIDRVVDHARSPYADDELSKALADFDYGSMRRLERTRLLVRAGPALGLMGTLIPLSPALAGLADGDVTALSDNLQVAFSVTVLGLLVGAVAFGVSLVRDRLYGQDLSELEYVAARLSHSKAPA